MASRSSNSDKPDGSSKPKSGPTPSPSTKLLGSKGKEEDLALESKDGKLSGAELKKKAKEEKMARRAKEKQGKQGAGQAAIPPETQLAEQGVPNVNGSTQKPPTAGPKQHKRTGSASANAPKQIPIRSTESQIAVTPPQSKEKLKRVAFFNHLYSGPRRTTIAGAGKDVHPAVLSLGIQISNYAICGSNARCVGMLLAFKKVRRQLSSRCALRNM